MLGKCIGLLIVGILILKRTPWFVGLPVGAYIVSMAYGWASVISDDCLKGNFFPSPQQQQHPQADDGKGSALCNVNNIIGTLLRLVLVPRKSPFKPPGADLKGHTLSAVAIVCQVLVLGAIGLCVDYCLGSEACWRYARGILKYWLFPGLAMAVNLNLPASKHSLGNLVVLPRSLDGLDGLLGSAAGKAKTNVKAAATANAKTTTTSASSNKARQRRTYGKLSTTTINGVKVSTAVAPPSRQLKKMSVGDVVDTIRSSIPIYNLDEALEQLYEALDDRYVTKWRVAREGGREGGRERGRLCTPLLLFSRSF